MPQVQPVISDPLRALSGSGPWDLVILRDGDPTSLRRNRTRTLEFLRSCRAHMNPDGILVMRVAVSDTYLGGGGGRLVATLATTLREVFPRLAALPGEEILLIAGGPEADLDLDSDRLGERLRDRGLESSELIPEMIPLFVDPERARSLSERLGDEAGINTIGRPRAVMLAAGLHEARAKPALLRLILGLERRSAWPLAAALGIAVFCLLAMSFSPRPPVFTTAAAVGFGSMGWWLLLIATWQATRGSVYSEIGALTAIFMAGLAGGAALACRWSQPARRLPLVLAAGATLSLLIAGGIAILFPLAAVPADVDRRGRVDRDGVPGPDRTQRPRQPPRSRNRVRRRRGGRRRGALVVGIIAIPWAGLTATAWGLAALHIAAIPAVLMALRRELIETAEVAIVRLHESRRPEIDSQRLEGLQPFGQEEGRGDERAAGRPLAEDPRPGRRKGRVWD